MKIIALFTLLFSANQIQAENIAPGAFSITRIHYEGGGDWYADPSSLSNLLEHLKGFKKINKTYLNILKYLKIRMFVNIYQGNIK